ncbi:hypothetical protein KFU94_03180 [Chloroflexi bacterium TSY]|nr:hypothetical protein [Chloroflexi bacterium TSY]
MSIQTQPDAQKWSAQAWTFAPLQLKKITILQVKPSVIFTALTEPEQMCRLFSWMHKIEVDNSEATEPNGLGAKRRCSFGNGMVLEEIIVGWQPPTRYAYRGVDETHPFGMVGHLGTIECQPVMDDSTRLIWEHYFEHSNPAAMLKKLNESVDAVLQSMVDIFQGHVISTWFRSE